MKKSRFLDVLMLAVAALACLACEPPVSETPSEPVVESEAEAEVEAEATSPPQEKAERRSVALGRRPFWHDGAMASSLGLSEAQISTMETRRQAALENQRAKRREATERRTEISLLMAEGQWDEARRLGLLVSEEAASSIQADVELKIGILQMLSAEQRKELLSESPGALRRSWLLPGGRSGGRGSNPLLERASPQ